MAGSFKHVLTDQRTYRGTNLLDDMGDMKEAIDEMAFIILALENTILHKKMSEDVRDWYYKCLRKEEPWPDFMKPGIEK